MGALGSAGGLRSALDILGLRFIVKEWVESHSFHEPLFECISNNFFLAIAPVYEVIATQ